MQWFETTHIHDLSFCGSGVGVAELVSLTLSWGYSEAPDYSLLQKLDFAVGESTFFAPFSCVCGKIYIKFTIVTISKCTLQWHYVHSSCCATITRKLSSSQLQPYPLNTNSCPPPTPCPPLTPSPLPPAPGSHHAPLYLCGFDYSHYLMEVELYSICPLVIGLFHLA